MTNLRRASTHLPRIGARVGVGRAPTPALALVLAVVLVDAGGCVMRSQLVARVLGEGDDSPADGDGDASEDVDPASQQCAGNPGLTSYRALGEGTAAAPYVLCTSLQLLDLMQPVNAAAWNSHFRLGADVDLTGYNQVTAQAVVPIGSVATPFSGVLEGGGHRVLNLTYRVSTQDRVGLFGTVSGSGARIERLTLVDADIAGEKHAGALAGFVDGGAQVVSCHASGKVEALQMAGGLVGSVGGDWTATAGGGSAALISTSSSTASVFASAMGGGLVGGLPGPAVLVDTYASGAVSVQEGYAGGLVGGAGADAIVIDSYATGAVGAGGGPTGGLIGCAIDAVIVACFATGNVDGGSAAGADVGALVGWGGPVVSSHSYAAATCTVGTGACHAAVAGETPDAVLADFFDPLSPPLASWDWVATWQVQAGTYPGLNPIRLERADWVSCAEHLAEEPFAGGRGTIENPYLICNAAQLDALAADASLWGKWKAFKLMADIDLAGVSTSRFPIGSAGSPFTGFFDGGGRVVRNFTLAVSDRDSIGFFGRMQGVVRRLGLENVNVSAGGASSGTGGIAGAADALFLVDSYTTGTVTGNADVGGLVGRSRAALLHTYSTATVRAAQNGGGLVGLGQGFGRVFGSFAASDVQVGSGGGGPLVSPASFPVTDCSYDSGKSCQGCTNSTGIAVPTVSAFYDASSPPLSGWDFERVWQSHAPSDLPTLRASTW